MRSTTFEVLYAYVNFQILLLNLPHIVLILNIKGKAETGTILRSLVQTGVATLPI